MITYTCTVRASIMYVGVEIHENIYWYRKNRLPVNTA